MTTHKNALANGTIIHQYQIESMIAHGGFGIVYKARHTHLDEAVVIKEYLPSEIATREGTTVHPYSASEQDDYQDGLSRFLDEVKQLVQFKQHPNIVSCRDFFAENGTAYLVMDFEDGLSLSELLKARNNEPLSEEHLIKMMLSLLDGLKLVHEKGVLHRDIKPGNIFIRREDEEPLLIDFGAAKQNFSKHSKSMAPYTVGYAPMEQVSEEGDLGPWTDIYAIGAVMWRIISGQNPVDVNKRLTAIIRQQPDPFTSAQEIRKNEYNDNLLKVIDKCLKPNEEDRFQSVSELVSELEKIDVSDTESDLYPIDNIPSSFDDYIKDPITRPRSGSEKVVDPFPIDPTTQYPSENDGFLIDDDGSGHNYQFVHQALRIYFENNTQSMYDLLLNNEQDALLEHLWSLVCDDCGEEQDVRLQDIHSSIIKIEECLTLLVEMPNAVNTFDAIMVAIVFCQNQQHFFVLERAGENKIFLCEWSNGEHRNLGTVIDASVDGVINEILERID